MSRPEDPFPIVQRDVRAAWATLTAHPGPPPGERAARLSALQADVADLSSAVEVARGDPGRFHLTADEVSSRAAFVSEMRHALSAYSAAPHASGGVSSIGSNSATSSSSRPSGGGGSLLPNPSSSSSFPKPTTKALLPGSANSDAKKTTTRRTGGGGGDAFVADQLQQQDETIAEQDGRLDELASAVQRIGALGRDMHVELEAQGDMLDGLASDMDGTVSRFKQVRGRLDRFVEEAGPRNLCTIVWLCVIFFVLTLLVVLT